MKNRVYKITYRKKQDDKVLCEDSIKITSSFKPEVGRIIGYNTDPPVIDEIISVEPVFDRMIGLEKILEECLLERLVENLISGSPINDKTSYVTLKAGTIIELPDGEYPSCVLSGYRYENSEGVETGIYQIKLLNHDIPVEGLNLNYTMEFKLNKYNVISFMASKFDGVYIHQKPKIIDDLI